MLRGKGEQMASFIVACELAHLSPSVPFPFSKACNATLDSILPIRAKAGKLNGQIGQTEASIQSQNLLRPRQN